MAFRRATVLGGSGFIGRYIVQRLARAGTVVRVGVRRPEGAHELQPLGNVGQIVGIRADVRDPGSLARAVEGADVVINLVGILYESGKATFAAIHHQGARNAAEAARQAGARRFLHVSALGADVHGPSEYARTKAAGEAAVFDTFPGAVVLRPSIVFGAEDAFFNRFAEISRFAPALPVFGCPAPRLARRDGALGIDLYGDGGTKFQPVYVGDVADAAMAALAEDDARGKVYELGGPKVYSFKEIMELMLSMTGRRRLLVPVPFWAAMLQASVFQLLPGAPLLTRDQVRQLRRDNVVGESALTLADLKITPKAAEAVLPTYMERYRRGGFRSRR